MSKMVGRVPVTGRALCRIAADGARCAIFVLDASAREHCRVGTAVRVQVEGTTDVIISHIESVSAIESSGDSVFHPAVFHAVCPLPAVDSSQLMESIGVNCCGATTMPAESLAWRFWKWVGDWVHG